MQLIGKYSSLGLLLFACILPLAPLLFGYFPAAGDMRDVFIPLESFFRTEQLQGTLPAWNPAVSFGFPVIAAAQIGFFYPVLFVLRFLPIWLELPIVLVAHVAFCAFGMFLFARRFGLSKEASFFTAISFSLSQFIWQHLTHLNIFLVIAWFPWQMLAVDILFKKERIERKGIIALVALFGIPFLIGQIQIPFLMMAVALLYGISIRKSLKRSVSPVLMIAIGTFLLACVQLLPTVELASLSSRNTTEGFDIVRANQHSYPLYHLPTFLFPKFYGSDDTYWGKRLEIEYGTYIGVIPLLFAIWFCVISFRTKQQDSRVSFFKWAAIISFLLALGSLSPFRLLGIESSLWIFSAPARWLLFTTFSLSLFAGLGFDVLFINPKVVKRTLQFLSMIFIVGIIIGNIALYFSSSLTTHPKLVSMIASAKQSSISFSSPYTYVPLLLLLVLPYAISHKKGKQIILILTAIDLVLIAGTTTPLIPWKNILQTPRTIEQLSSEVKNHEARIYSLRDGGDTGAYFTDPSSRANTAIRELQKNLLVPMVSSQFGIYGIEWPASLDLQEQGMVLERLHPTQPYAIEDMELAQELTIGVVLSPASNGTVDVKPLKTKSRFEVVNGAAELISEKPSELVIRTNAKQDTTLIVRDTFYPGWHAYIDGKEVLITKSPLFFRSISLPAGEHVVTMRYIPKMLYIGGIISLLTLFSLVIARLRK